MPSFQQLRYLAAVVEHGHFGRAAEACHVTQPTLSAQLRVLEDKLGAPLLERTRTGVVATALGGAVVAHARRALREVGEIKTLAQLHQGPLQSTIKVGVVQSLGSYFLPLIVPELHESHPMLKLYVREGVPEHLLARLTEGALDLLFFPLPLGTDSVRSRALFREPLYAVVPRDHPLARAPAIAPHMLRGETVLALERGHKLFSQVAKLCAAYGAQLSQDYEGTSLDTLRQMVAMGMGISLLPALYVKSEVAHQDMVVARPFQAAPPSRTIGMVWRPSSPRTEEFEELRTQICTILARRAPEVTVLG